MNNKQDKELVQLIQDVVDGKVQKRSCAIRYIKKYMHSHIQYIGMKQRVQHRLKSSYSGMQ